MKHEEPLTIPRQYEATVIKMAVLVERQAHRSVEVSCLLTFDKGITGAQWRKHSLQQMVLE